MTLVDAHDIAYGMSGVAVLVGSNYYGPLHAPMADSGVVGFANGLPIVWLQLGGFCICHHVVHVSICLES